MSAPAQGTLGALLGAWIIDLRAALHALRSGRGSLLLTLVILALGIAASACLYALVSTVLVRSLPYPQPERLVRVFEVHKEGVRPSKMADPNAEDLRQQVKAFEGLAQYASMDASVGVDAIAERARVAVVSPEFFEVMGVAPVQGRWLKSNEQGVVLAHSHWQRLFPEGSSLQGQRVRIGDRWYDVAGVMPPDFGFPQASAAWLLREPESLRSSRTALNAAVIARLRTGVDSEAAAQELSSVAQALGRRYGADIWMQDAALVGLHKELSAGLRGPLLATQSAALLLLLIAIANALGLQQARLRTRDEELAVRVALGAGRARLARQLALEATLIGFVSTLLGLGLAALILHSLPAWGADVLGALQNQTFASPTLGADTLGLALLAWLLLAVAMSLPGLRWLLRPSSTVARGSARVLSAAPVATLVIAQIALSLLLLFAASLVGRQLLQVLSLQPGFETAGVLALGLSYPYPEDAEASARLAQRHQLALERLASLPGVRDVGATSVLPFAGGGASGTFLKLAHAQEVQDFDDFSALARQPERTGQAAYRVVSEDYFRSLSMPLLRGRAFSEQDTPEGVHAAVVSASLAARSWPGEDPVGRLLQFGNMDGDLRAMQIVGVVGDIREAAPDAEPEPTVYALYRQRPRATADIEYVLKTAADPLGLSGPARSLMQEIAPGIPALVRSLDQVQARALGRRSLLTHLLGAFAATALLLVAAGVHGTVSLQLAQRRRELGLRAAVGARPGQLGGLLIAQGLRLATWGVVIGLTAAALLGAALSAYLPGFERFDPAAMALSAALILGSVLVASALPARRAAALMPLDALRGAGRF